ncbi:MAG: alkene reductase [Ignavibacteriae bacterium]|nr:alkene reductase [Ignavibacteriota bacterium]
MENIKLFESFKLGNTELQNHVVMAPMTRSRAIGNVPNALMAEYYAQRAGAGLIVTEGVSPSPNGLGYARIPGIFSNEQIAGWKLVTDAVHSKGGKIFMQIMHTGRIGHEANLPEGAKIVAPSAIKADGKMWTDTKQMQDHPVPSAFTSEELKTAKEEFIASAKNAVEAGFDGIELHGANGYLLEQFISPHSNKREDEYGGNIENRCRFVLEVAKGCADAIGKEKVAIRLSPYGAFNDMPAYPETEDTYKYLAAEINKTGLVYIHIVDHSSMGAPEVPRKIKEIIREEFRNTLILSGGYGLESAEKELENGIADLVAFGKPFINNPDFVERLKNGRALNTDLNMDAFYTPDEKGYTDYPFYTK